MASGNNIYSKVKYREVKKIACNSQPRAARETATRHQVSARPDRQYHKTANSQKFSKHVSLLAHSENIKI